MTRRGLYGLLARGCVLVALMIGGLSQAALAGPFSQLVVFGDSLSDNGNLYAASGGTDPLSPPYYNGRFSNGPVWSDVVQSRTGVTVQNYAYGGATSGTDNVASSFPGQYPGLQQQIQSFALANAAVADPNALYVVWAGSNDFIFLDPGAGPAAVAALVEEVITNIIVAVGSLKAMGAQNIVVGMLPDLGLTPRAQDLGVGAALTELSATVNAGLASILPMVVGDVDFFDAFAALNNIVGNAAAFGFTNVSDACLNIAGPSICSDPDSYVFWDSIHPTAGVHQIIAEHFMTYLVSVPMAAGFLLLGFVIIGMRRQFAALAAVRA